MQSYVAHLAMVMRSFCRANANGVRVMVDNDADGDSDDNVDGDAMARE